jgi:hypothetical protein
MEEKSAVAVRESDFGVRRGSFGKMLLFVMLFVLSSRNFTSVFLCSCFSLCKEKRLK